MKRALVLIAACGAKAPPRATPIVIAAAPAKTEVTLHYRLPPAGSRWHAVSAYTYDLTTAGGAVHAERDLDKTFEVVAFDHGVVSDERVAYAVDRNTMTARGVTRESPAPLEGKAYRITAGPVVKRDDGSDVPAAEAQAVIGDTHFGTGAEAFEKYVEGKTFTEGVTVELPADVLSQFSGSFGAGRVEMTFTGMDGALAAFQMSIAMSGDSNSAHFAATLVGRVLFDPETTRTASMSMTGPLQVTGAGKQAMGTTAVHAAITELE